MGRLETRDRFCLVSTSSIDILNGPSLNFYHEELNINHGSLRQGSIAGVTLKVFSDNDVWELQEVLVSIQNRRAHNSLETVTT